MIHRETTNAWKAGLLFALGAVFALFGMILAACSRSAAGQTVAEQAAPVANLLGRGPAILLSAGGALATFAAVVIGIDWYRRHPDR